LQSILTQDVLQMSSRRVGNYCNIMKHLQLFFAVLAVVLIVVFSYKWLYPYGNRSCVLPCTLGALEHFAVEHEGWYPNQGMNAVDCLSALYPNLETELAGISGDRNEVSRRLATGKPIDESVSSWVYIPGLRTDDDPELALIWERRKGVGFNGRRKDGYAVGFVSGGFEQIASEDWPEFAKRQETLRESVLSSREMQIPVRTTLR
jgi:hypothetical protein